MLAEASSALRHVFLQHCQAAFQQMLAALRLMQDSAKTDKKKDTIAIQADDLITFRGLKYEHISVCLRFGICDTFHLSLCECVCVCSKEFLFCHGLIFANLYRSKEEQTLEDQFELDLRQATGSGEAKDTNTSKLSKVFSRVLFE